MKALLLFLICSSAFAIPEESYDRVWNSDVLVWYQDLQPGEFKNAQGLKIRYRFKVQDNALRTLVILPGRSEAMINYAEMMYDLRHPEVNVFIMDHQGQGESDRLLSGDAGHVIKFKDYVLDVRQFMNEVVIPLSGDTERMLLAHSMGATIGVHYLHMVPTGFAKAVLSAPMLQMNTKPYSETVATLYSTFLFLAGKGAQYAPGRGPYNPETDVFDTNTSTHSLVRWAAMKRFWAEDPQLILGGPTVRWVKESLAASKRTLTLAPRIKTPVVIFQAGQDQVVVNGRQNSFCLKLAKCQITLFPTAHHNVLNEKDEIRNKVVERIQSFLDLN